MEDRILSLTAGTFPAPLHLTAYQNPTGATQTFDPSYRDTAPAALREMALAFAPDGRQENVQPMLAAASTLEKIMGDTPLSDFLTLIAVKWARVGSREICDPAPTDTDDDYLVLADSDAATSLVLTGSGFDLQEKVDQRWEFEECDPGDGSVFCFSSWLRGNVNILLTSDPEFYRKFMVGTALSKRLNLLAKDERRQAMRAVLTGRWDLSVLEAALNA